MANSNHSAFSEALIRSEQFISFRSFTHDLLTDRSQNRTVLKPYLRKRTPGAGRKFLEDLSNQIAFEAWHRAQADQNTSPDNVILNAEDICSDLDSFIQKFHF